MTTRTATTTWAGGLQRGSGQVNLDSSGAGRFEVSFPSRSGNPEGLTSPEELIAAAQSSCLAMNMSGVLESEGLRAESITVSADVTLGPSSQGGFAISAVALRLRADVPGLDPARFAALADIAERTCPVSRLLAGAPITLDAALA